MSDTWKFSLSLAASTVVVSLLIPITIQAVWWNPLSWFSDTSEIQEIQQANVSQVSWFPENSDEPEITEKIIEVPVKEVVIEYVEVPVEKIVTQIVTEPADPNLIIEIQQWEMAFDELKSEIANLVSASSTQAIIDAFNDINDEYTSLHTSYVLFAESQGFPRSQVPTFLKIGLPKPEVCYFSSTGDTILGVAKGKIVCALP